MRKVLSLDISTKTGWALFIDGKPEKWGTVFPDKTAKDFGDYPMNFIRLAEYLADRFFEEMKNLGHAPDEVVIEETNGGSKNCYSQKMLEYLHFCFNKKLWAANVKKVSYVRTGSWRIATSSVLSKEEKALNAKISRIKSKTGKKLAKIDGKVVGKKGRKHAAIRRVEELFGISMQRKDEDAADALLLAQAYISGCPICDGSTQGGKNVRR